MSPGERMVDGWGPLAIIKINKYEDCAQSQTHNSIFLSEIWDKDSEVIIITADSGYLTDTWRNWSLGDPSNSWLHHSIWISCAWLLCINYVEMSCRFSSLFLGIGSINCLTHLPLDKMAVIWQTFSNAFSWMKFFYFDSYFIEICS